MLFPVSRVNYLESIAVFAALGEETESHTVIDALTSAGRTRVESLISLAFGQRMVQLCRVV